MARAITASARKVANAALVDLHAAQFSERQRFTRNESAVLVCDQKVAFDCWRARKRRLTNALRQIPLVFLHSPIWLPFSLSIGASNHWIATPRFQGRTPRLARDQNSPPSFDRHALVGDNLLCATTIFFCCFLFLRLLACPSSASNQQVARWISLAPPLLAARRCAR